MGVNSDQSDNLTGGIVPPAFRVLREGRVDKKFRTLEVLPTEGELPVPGDYRAVPSGKSLEVRRQRPLDEEALSLSVKGLEPGAQGVPMLMVPQAYSLSSVKEFLWLPLEPVPAFPQGKGFRFSLLLEGGRPAKLTDRLQVTGRKMFSQVTLNRPLPLMEGLRTTLQAPGSEPREGLILFCGPSGPAEWSTLEDLLRRRAGAQVPLQNLWETLATLRGWTRLPAKAVSLWPEGTAGLGEPGKGVPYLRLENCLYNRRFLETTFRQIKRRSRRSGGFPLSELPKDLSLPREVTETLVTVLESEAAVSREGKHLLPPQGERQGFLSPVARQLLAEIEKAGETGYPRRQVEDKGLVPVADELMRMSLVFDLGGGYLSPQGMDKKLEALTAGWKTGEEIILSEVKEAAALSRREILPLLDELNRRGVFRWEGEKRFYQPGKGQGKKSGGKKE